MLVVIIGQNLSAKEMSVEQIGEVGPDNAPRGVESDKFDARRMLGSRPLPY
jgi:hypothetical protein